MAIPFSFTQPFTSSFSLYRHHYLSHWNDFNGHVIVTAGQSMAIMVGRYWDRGLIEIMGPLGLQRLFHFLTFNLELLATGFLPHYALLLLSLSWLAALYLGIMNLRLYFGYDLGLDVGVGLCGLIVSSAGK
jgi:hypothetical protein